MKTQISLEYATTYGWGLLIVAVVIGSLAYFGSFESERHSKGFCNMGPQIKCENIALSLDGKLVIGFQNNIYSDITITSFRLVEENLACDVLTPVLYTGEDTTILCDLGIAGYAGDSEEFNIELLYKLGDKDKQFTVSGNARTGTEEIIDLAAICDSDGDGYWNALSIVCGGDDCFDNDINTYEPICIIDADCNIGEICEIPTDRCSAECVIP